MDLPRISGCKSHVLARFNMMNSACTSQSLISATALLCRPYGLISVSPLFPTLTRWPTSFAHVAGCFFPRELLILPHASQPRLLAGCHAIPLPKRAAACLMFAREVL